LIKQINVAAHVTWPSAGDARRGLTPGQSSSVNSTERPSLGTAVLMPESSRCCLPLGAFRDRRNSAVQKRFVGTASMPGDSFLVQTATDKGLVFH
jgi:hypothetical protein